MAAGSVAVEVVTALLSQAVKRAEKTATKSQGESFIIVFTIGEQGPSLPAFQSLGTTAEKATVIEIEDRITGA